MKNLNLYLVAVVLFFATLFTLTSCSKEENSLNETLNLNSIEVDHSQNEVVLSENIKVDKGILQFKNLESFQNSLLALNRMPKEERLQWEAALNFVSVQSVFDEIILAEFETDGQNHSELYHQKLETGVIIPDEHTGLYQLNLFNPAYAYVLSEQGLVVVDHTLYRFTSGQLQAWPEANLDQLDLMLNNSLESEIIYSVHNENQVVQLRNTTEWNEECLSEDNGEQLYLSASFNSHFPDQDSKNILFVDYSVQLRVLIPNGNGEMEFDPNASYKLFGTSETHLPISNEAEESVQIISEEGFASGTGGNYTYISEAVGEHRVDLPFYFSGYASLEMARWNVVAVTSNHNYFECELTL